MQKKASNAKIRIEQSDHRKGEVMSQHEEQSATPAGTPFADLRRTTPDGDEYWLASELARALGYQPLESFAEATARAQIACVNSGWFVPDHFAPVKAEDGIVTDYRLSRYACYLAIQNADPNKKPVALGQTYFALQTRLKEEYDIAALNEEERRLFLRDQIAKHNKDLAEAAKLAGVTRGYDFAIFQDHGYMGLYGGLRAADIHTRKGLKSGQQILDHMGSEELAANLFRATQTESKLKRDAVADKGAANQTHFDVGKEVRETIIRLGGTLPEDLPTPKKSIQQLKQDEKKRQKLGGQMTMFGFDDESES
jgi:DNA-damage-inducible protein D